MECTLINVVIVGVVVYVGSGGGRSSGHRCPSLTVTTRVAPLIIAVVPLAARGSTTTPVPNKT